MTWPADWSSDVVEGYDALARKRGWSASTMEAVASTAQHIRGLARSDGPHQHFAGELDGERWFFEAVVDHGDLVVIRQIHVDADGAIHRYSWRWLEDDDGGLTDQSLDGADSLAPTTAAHFDGAWNVA